MMKIQKQSGFTLIELVMVIVILGILAAVALPKFVDLKTDASVAATQGIAGAYGSASAINKAIRNLGGTNGVSIASCDGVVQALSVTVAPAGYTVATTAIATASSTTCVISGPNSTTASFIGHGVA